jgi:DNA-binding transcriptional LysR family regulator
MLLSYRLGGASLSGTRYFMELRHLRYFVAVGDALSFTKAAENLHLAQPSLTRQIQDLETEIGVRLLNRSKRQVSLTQEGRSFLSDAKRVLAHSADIVESVQRLNRHETAALNIGYVANLFPAPLPAALSAFQRKFPTVSINLFDMTYGDQLRALEKGKIDLGFVGSQETIEERGLQSRSIGVNKIVVALRKGDRLAKKTVVNLKELKPMFFVGMSEESYPGYRDWLTATCRQAGFAPKVLQDVDIERMVIQAVGAGLGVALLPDQVEKLPHENVVFRPLVPSVLTQSCVAWNSENTSIALRAYVEIMKERSASLR